MWLECCRLPVGPGGSPALWRWPPPRSDLRGSPPPTRSGTAGRCKRSPESREPRSRGRQEHNTSPLGDISLPSQREFSQMRKNICLYIYLFIYVHDKTRCGAIQREIRPRCKDLRRDLPPLVPLLFLMIQLSCGRRERARNWSARDEEEI